MQKVDLKEATKQLEELINKASQGEEIIIISNDGEPFQILPLKFKTPKPKFGSAKGLIEMSDDFDEPLNDFDEYTR
ncbi:MAG: type II toxin-antitoxin system Phd/YefM family antitoxin [Crocosphaera sp.]